MESSLPESKQKKCSMCGASFTCGITEDNRSCWCYVFPPIMPLESSQDCRCPQCLAILINEKINDVDVKSALKIIRKNKLNNGSVFEGIDYYIQNGFWVFTKWYHLKRGTCCNNGCRHCPYK